MSILLTKHHDITDFASKDASRYVINSTHYNAGKKLLEATDGKILIRVPVTESDEFPPVKGENKEAPIDCIIPIGPLKKALGNIPKSANMPILEYSKLDSNGKVTLTTTDMDTEQAVTCRPIEGNYPNVDQVIPITEPKVTIALGASILKRMADYALRHSTDADCTVRIEIVDEMSPIRFSINIEDVNGPSKATGVAMPVRLT